MNYPPSVYEIIKKASDLHSKDIPAAVAFAFKEVRRLKEYDELVNQLVYDAVQRLVYEARHETNRTIKREQGSYGQPAKVNRASKSVAQVYQSVYEYRLAGRTLGDMTHEDLLLTRSSEEGLANGHTLNARMCEVLADIVPEGKKVREVIKEKRLREIFQEVHGCVPVA